MVSENFKDKPANILCTYSKSPPNNAQPACSEQLLETASQLP